MIKSNLYEVILYHTSCISCAIHLSSIPYPQPEKTKKSGHLGQADVPRKSIRFETTHLFALVFLSQF